MIEPDTYPKLLLRNVEIWGNRVALRRKDRGIWRRYTWKDCYERIKQISLGLVSLGLQPSDKVALIGDDEPEGYWAEIAIQATRGVLVAMWSDSIPSEIAYIINHSDSKFVIAEDQEQVDKILELRDKNEIPSVQKVIYWDRKGMRQYDDPILMSYQDLMKIGSDYEKAHPGIFEHIVAEGKGSDLVQLSYTSGTTGLPKGVMLTHNAILASAKTMQEFVQLGKGEDILSTLAAASAFHQWFAGFNYLCGVIINIPEEPETIMQDYREISPRFILMAPRQWQSLTSMTQIKVNDAGFLNRLFYNLLLPVGYRMADFRSSKRRTSLFWKLLYKLGDKTVFEPLRDKLGLKKTKYPTTGSAFLSPDFFRFFQAIGLNIIQIYGGTEAGAVSMHPQDNINIDSVGRLGTNVRLKISDEQEILVTGDGVFSGYYKEPEKTKNVLKNGWFHTGDAGFVNDEAHLIFLDRLVDLDELSGGRKYAPGYIEGKLKFSRFITEALVIGGKERDYLSVVIIIDFDSVGKWAEANHITYTTFVDLSQKDVVSKLIQEDIRRVNKALPEDTQIMKFVLLHKEFDPDEAELTRTRKLRRGFLQEHYHELINAIYENREEIPVVADVKYRDGRKATVETNIRIRSVYEDMRTGEYPGL